MLSKLRKLAERRPASPEWLKPPGVFDQQLAQLWFDCHVTGGPRVLPSWPDALGTDQLVYGTNFGG